MADRVAEKMSEASTALMSAPKKGERFRCETCGMEIQVTVDCKCKNAEPAHFHCCGQEMSKV